MSKAISQGHSAHYPMAATQLDIPFSVNFTHQIRFTDNVFGADRDALSSVLTASENFPARVQVWIDAAVAQSRPEIADVFAELSKHSKHFNVVGVHALPGGEIIKNDWTFISRILKDMNDADLDRRSYVVAIGGGALLDAVGFAAATAHRGIRLVRIPTTTLAQGDSGVGVKNAVNYFGKKNWLGTFNVPWAVINDTRLLTTLPDRDFISGFSECIKVTLLKSPAHFDELCRDAEMLGQRNMPATVRALRNSVEWHLHHITAGGDPFETLEARPLDFGHWSAHKIETITNFAVRHGEAVGIGVALDCVYSSLVHGFPMADTERVLRCLTSIGTAITHPVLNDQKKLLSGLEEFRQHLGGRLTLTMLRNVGVPLEVHDIDTDAMSHAISRLKAYALRAQHTGQPC